MKTILDWFQLEDFFPLLTLIFLLTFVGGQMAPADNNTRKWSQFVFVGGFLAYACLGINAWGIPSVSDAVLIVTRAILAGGTAYGLGLIAISLGTFLWEYGKAMRAPPDQLPVKTPEPVVVRQPEPERLPLPPLPTHDELAEQAKAKYRNRLELIERANLDPLEEKSGSLFATRF